MYLEDSAQATSAAAPLGTTRRIVSTQADSELVAGKLRERRGRLMRWALQAHARELLPDDRGIGACFKAPIPSRQVGVYFSPSHGSASYGGLMRCGSVWQCPVCASIISERRRRELELAIARAQGQHLAVYLESLTVAHSRADDLSALLAAFLRATRRIGSGRWGETFKRSHGLVGAIRALELTHGGNGWHPHCHRLVFLSDDADAGAYAETMRKRWEYVAGRCGLRMNEHGYDFRPTFGSVSDYVSKWGHEPAYDLPWGVSAELAKAHIKAGRGVNLSAFGLLRASFDGDDQAGERFREYAGVFKRRNQLVWTPYLREWLGLGSGEGISDEELVQLEEADAYLLGLLSSWQWRQVLKLDARGDLLEVARSGSWEMVRAFLAEIGVSRSA